MSRAVCRRCSVTRKPSPPVAGSDGPSWLTFLGQAKDSLWSIDLFRCESLSLRTHWVLVVMDQFTRRIIGLPRRELPCNLNAECSQLIWHSPRNCRWAVTVLDAPASNSRASVAEVSQ